MSTIDAWPGRLVLTSEKEEVKVIFVACGAALVEHRTGSREEIDIADLSPLPADEGKYPYAGLNPEAPQ